MITNHVKFGLEYFTVLCTILHRSIAKRLCTCSSSRIVCRLLIGHSMAEDLKLTFKANTATVSVQICITIIIYNIILFCLICHPNFLTKFKHISCIQQMFQRVIFSRCFRELVVSARTVKWNWILKDFAERSDFVKIGDAVTQLRGHLSYILEFITT